MRFVDDKKINMTLKLWFYVWGHQSLWRMQDLFTAWIKVLRDSTHSKEVHGCIMYNWGRPYIWMNWQFKKIKTAQAEYLLVWHMKEIGKARRLLMSPSPSSVLHTTAPLHSAAGCFRALYCIYVCIRCQATVNQLWWNHLNFKSYLFSYEYLLLHTVEKHFIRKQVSVTFTCPTLAKTTILNKTCMKNRS